jgi:streptogrisin D
MACRFFFLARGPRWQLAERMTSIRSTAARAVTAGLLGLSTLGIAASNAGAAPTAPTILDQLPSPVRDRMIAQTPLVDAASVIRTAVNSAEQRGYAGIVISGDHVDLWWKGALPADIARAVAAAQGLAPIEVHRAAFSHNQLKVAAAKLDRVVDKDKSDAAHDVRIANDGSGLEVVIDHAAGARTPALPQAGVPIKTVRQAPRKLVATREDDAAPWSGGARIWSNHGAGCTAGFGVKNADTGTPYILIAGHCGDLGTTWFDGTGEEQIGTVVGRNADQDTELVTAASTSNKVYVGTMTDGVQARVSGWTDVFPGQILCQSGVTSVGGTGAPVCNLRVENLNEGTFDNLVYAEQLDGLQSALPGDSGGPVYQVQADGSILAAGTSTWTSGTGFGFQDFATARGDFGNIVPAESANSCRVSYQVAETWNGGYKTNVTIYTTGAVNGGWNLEWTVPAGIQIQGRWGAQFTQAGNSVTATNESYNGTIPAGGAVAFGFTAGGTPSNPAAFTLNGSACS